LPGTHRPRPSPGAHPSPLLAVAFHCARREGPRRGHDDERTGRDRERRRRRRRPRRSRAPAHPSARLGAPANDAKCLRATKWWRRSVKPAPFEYVAAHSVEEALAALAVGGEDAKPIAGGQSLMPALNMRLVRPSLLVDVNRAGLDGIVHDNGT